MIFANEFCLDAYTFIHILFSLKQLEVCDSIIMMTFTSTNVDILYVYKKYF